MTTKHTPGPWYAVNHCDNPNWPAVSPAPMDTFSPLAEVFDARGLHENHAEQLANARLIAAAPELLEACHQAIGALKGEHDGFLRAAIAKATGAQP